MKPKSIGIVGGAGPLAGSALVEKILVACNKTYGCYKDVDYPELFLISYPFSDMLCGQADKKQISLELTHCLEKLIHQGAEFLAIACNTLHAFLDENHPFETLVSIPSVLSSVDMGKYPPLVLCTSTSRFYGVHSQSFECQYPDAQTQERIDKIIDQILRGEDRTLITNRLCTLIKDQSASTLILGCTELSMFTESLKTSGKTIIDPLDQLTTTLVKMSFANPQLLTPAHV